MSGSAATWSLIASVLLVMVAFSIVATPRAGAYDDWNPAQIGFPSNSEPKPRADCTGGSDRCIDRTIGEMWRRFHTEIPFCENNNVFSLTYLRVTEAIREAVDDGFYPDEHWLNHQDAIFARTYFLTYDNWASGRRDLVPESWLTAFDTAKESSVNGLGNLLLSMNAHVNRDFPFILYHAGLADEGGSKKAEHDSGNDVLHALYKPMLTEIAQRFDETTDDYDVPGIVLDDEMFFQLLVTWRETTWQNAKRLADATSDAERRQVAADIESYANFWAALIVAGTSYLPGQTTDARDARCEAHGGQRAKYRRGAEEASAGKAASLAGHRLTAIVRCPDGIGPCAGNLKVRLPARWGGGRRVLAGTRRYFVEPDASGRIRVPVGENAAALADAGKAWIATRSKLGPGDSVTKRRKVRLTVR